MLSPKELLFVRREILQELGTFKRIDAFQVMDVQHSLELVDALHAFAFHPRTEEPVVLFDDCGGMLVERTAHFHG